jgi:hypothetical protein
MAELTGRNFYDEVAASDNASELRRRVEGSLRGGGHADSFDFTPDQRRSPARSSISW